MLSLTRDEVGVTGRRSQQETRTKEEGDDREIGSGGLNGLRVGAVLAILDGFAAIGLAAGGLRGAAAGGVVGEEFRCFQDAVLRRQEPEGDEQQREEAIARSAHVWKRVGENKESQS